MTRPLFRDSGPIQSLNHQLVSIQHPETKLMIIETSNPILHPSIIQRTCLHCRLEYQVLKISPSQLWIRFQHKSEYSSSKRSCRRSPHKVFGALMMKVGGDDVGTRVGPAVAMLTATVGDRHGSRTPLAVVGGHIVFVDGSDTHCVDAVHVPISITVVLHDTSVASSPDEQRAQSYKKEVLLKILFSQGLTRYSDDNFKKMSLASLSLFFFNFTLRI